MTGKRIIFFVLVFVGVLPLLNAQNKNNQEIGLALGASSYYGDINKERFMYAPRFSGGIFYRYVLNPRYSLRSTLSWVPVKGDDADFNYEDNLARGASFSTGIIDMSLQFEFNFLKFKYTPRKIVASPYVSGGLGVSFGGIGGSLSVPMDAYADFFRTSLVIPFGVGARLALTKKINMAIGLEFRKTFTDRVDGVNFPLNTAAAENGNSTISWSAHLSHTDWYYFAGVTISYKINYDRLLCPAYGND